MILVKVFPLAIFAALDGQVAGIFSIADQIREDAHKALAELRKSGIQKMIMLTGDYKHTTRPETISRKLTDFETARYIRQKPHRKIEVLDLDELLLI